jgi:hypothetical protein
MIALNKVGTSWKTRMGIGGLWLPWSAVLTNGTTPTRIGFGNWNGTPECWSIDYFDLQ